MYYFGNTYQSPINGVIPNTGHMGMHYSNNAQNNYYTYHTIRPLIPFQSNPNSEISYVNNHRCLPQSMMNLSTFPIEQQYQQQQPQMGMGFLQKKTNISHLKEKKLPKNEPKYFDDLVGLILPTKKETYATSNENTLRKKKQYNLEFQSKYPQFNSIKSSSSNNNDDHDSYLDELERKDSADYFIESNPSELKNEKVRSERKLLPKKQNNSEQESKSESFINNAHLNNNQDQHLNKLEKLNDRNNKIKLQKELTKSKQSASISFRKSRSQHKINKKPSFNTKNSKNKMNKNDSIKDCSDSDSISNVDLLSMVTDDEKIAPKVIPVAGPIPVSGVPPPAPPLTSDLFKRSDPNLFDRLKKVKKPPIPRGADEKTSKTFDLVVNELKTKLNKIKSKGELNVVKIEMASQLSSQQNSCSEASSSLTKLKQVEKKIEPILSKKAESRINHNPSFYKPTNKDIEVIKNVLKQIDLSKSTISKQVLKNRESSLAANFKSNSSVFSNNNLGKNCFKPIIDNGTAKQTNHDSFKYGQVKLIKKPGNSLTCSTTNSEQTSSNPNLDTTQLSNSSLTSNFNRQQQQQQQQNKLDTINSNITCALKQPISVSSSNGICQMPKETSSGTKIINSVPNSFKLELFDNVNSDEDSDDYSKYNRVKFSPTNIEKTNHITDNSADIESVVKQSPNTAIENNIKTININNIPITNSNSKSISFSFKNKSTELLKKIQKRNTFAFPKNAKIPLDNFECSEDTSSSVANVVNCENKLFKSKSEHIKKNIDKNLMLNSINLDSLDISKNNEMTTGTSIFKKNPNQNPNINFIKVSPRVRSIAAFSTRNLFRNFETLSPNDNEINKKSNLLTACESTIASKQISEMDNSMKIQSFKAKIYDNLMKSTGNIHTKAEIVSSPASIKNEFKPHILHLSIQQKELNDSQTKLKINNSNGEKEQSTKVYGRCEELNMNLSNNSCKILNKPQILTQTTSEPLNENPIDNKNTGQADSNILNSKSTGQIPSKYSSFTDYNKNKNIYTKHDRLKVINKSSTNLNDNQKLDEIFNDKMKINAANQNVDYFDDMFDYNPFSMQNYEYNPSYLNFNYFNDNNNNINNSTGTTIESKSTDTIEKLSNTAIGFQMDKNQRLNDYLVEMTNYYRNFNSNYNSASAI